jgi:acyl carrier protein
MAKDHIVETVKKTLMLNLKQRGLPVKIGNTDPLINSGLIDSLGALELVGALEKKFKLKINPEEMTEFNFNSIERIAEFVEQKIKRP